MKNTTFHISMGDLIHFSLCDHTMDLNCREWYGMPDEEIFYSVYLLQFHSAVVLCTPFFFFFCGVREFARFLPLFNFYSALSLFFCKKKNERSMWFCRFHTIYVSIVCLFIICCTFSQQSNQCSLSLFCVFFFASLSSLFILFLFQRLINLSKLEWMVYEVVRHSTSISLHCMLHQTNML